MYDGGSWRVNDVNQTLQETHKALLDDNDTLEIDRLRAKVIELYTLVDELRDTLVDELRGKGDYRAEKEQLREKVKELYTERAHVLAALAKIMPGHDDYDDLTVGMAWHQEAPVGFRNVLVIEDKSDGAQMSWHIHDNDTHLFNGAKRLDHFNYDGHTTEQKYAILEQLTAFYRSCDAKDLYNHKHNPDNLTCKYCGTSVTIAMQDVEGYPMQAYCVGCKMRGPVKATRDEAVKAWYAIFP